MLSGESWAVGGGHCPTDSLSAMTTSTSHVLSVNIGRAMEFEHTSASHTGIDKRPVDHPVMVTAPGPKHVAGSGLAGDDVCDLRHHGGNDQAVYAYAREDLDNWSSEIGRHLPDGCFGENLTTAGLDITNAIVGERWAVGHTMLEVSDPRIPCRTFAGPSSCLRPPSLPRGLPSVAEGRRESAAAARAGAGYHPRLSSSRKSMTAAFAREM